MFYPPRRLSQGTTFLLVAMGLGFLLSFVMANFLTQEFGLIPRRVLYDGRLWQVVTYMFLHGNLIHLLFNMLSLYLFGEALNQLWGEKTFLIYFFICGIGAALTQIAVMPESTIATIGASGAIYGLLYAWAREFPDSVVYLYGLFPMRARHLVILLFILEFVFSYSPSPIARFAHLGGLITGWLYFRVSLLPALWTLPKIRIQWSSKPKYTTPSVDDILEKINTVGIESLTPEERQVLDRESHKLTVRKYPLE